MATERRRRHTLALANSGGSGWSCPHCTTLNRPSNLNCTVCTYKQLPGRSSISVADLHAEQEKLLRPHPTSDRILWKWSWRRLFTRKPYVWTCPKCTCDNGSAYTACTTCGFRRDVQRNDNGKTVEKKSDGDDQRSAADILAWLRCKIWGNERKIVQPGEGESTWACAKCTYLNPSHLASCSACDLKRNGTGGDATSSRTSQQPWDSSYVVLDAPHAPSRHPVERDGLLSPVIPDCISSPHSPPFHSLTQPCSPPVVDSIPPSSYHLSLRDREGRWQCYMCGAYNLNTLSKCFLCNIGTYRPQGHLEPSIEFSQSELPPPAFEFSYNGGVMFVFPPSQEWDQSRAAIGTLGRQEANNSSVSDKLSLPRQNGRKTVDERQNGHVTVDERSHDGADEFVFPGSFVDQSYSFGPPGLVLSETETRRVNQPAEESPVAESPGPVRQFSHTSPRQSLELDPSTVAPPHDSLPGETGTLLSLHRSTEIPRLATRVPFRTTLRRPSRLLAHRLSDPSSPLEESVRPECRQTKSFSKERQEDLEEACEQFAVVLEYCKQSGEPFTDPDFPPADKSLYLNPKNSVSHWRVAQWLRPRDILDPLSAITTRWEVFRNPGLEDIAQGVLGNCWVLSALVVIAEQPRLIQRIMMTQEVSAEGVYQVRLCRDGRWEVVMVDDCLPCYRGGELVFSKSYRKQLWVPLIEKALAKTYGSYEALNAGRILAGLSILTGLPCEKIYLRKRSPNDSELEYDLIWAQLLSFRDMGCPMGASCGGLEIVEEDYAKVGLEPNHAYSVLTVEHIVGDQKLIRLRNPWGKFAWNGDWSDQDPRWTPELREKLKAYGGDGGIFWMSFEDFVKYFCEVDVCKYRPNWHCCRQTGRLLDRAPSQQQLLAFDVGMTTEVDISLYQPSVRGESSSRNLVDIAVLVMCYPTSATDGSNFLDSPNLISLPVSCEIASGSHIETTITCSGFLDPGSYVVLPLAFNHWEAPVVKSSGCGSRDEVKSGDEDSIPCVVALFSAHAVQYHSVQTRPGFLAESLFLLAAKEGTRTQAYPKMAFYEAYLRHSCRILIAVNEDPHYHFTVACLGEGSSNVISSRGNLNTIDCVPPMHRQVLMVVTQMEVSEAYTVHMRIDFTRSKFNLFDQWGATNDPEIAPCIAELHSPRLIG